MRCLCLFLALQFSAAVHLGAQVPGIPMVPDVEAFSPEYIEAMDRGSPGNPSAAMKFFAYHPDAGSTVCQTKSEVALHATPTTPVKDLNAPNSTWTGFCQIGLPQCPVSLQTQDYSFYAKATGSKSWAGASAGKVDRHYCYLNGWLTPEYLSIVNNFTALHAKAKEDCDTKWAKDNRYGYFTATATGGVTRAIAGSAKRNLLKTAKKLSGEGATKQALIGELMVNGPGGLLMDEEGAHRAAAWNCALGDLGCDIAYCNYAYCVKENGQLGAREECEGWDPVTGMPGLGFSGYKELGEWMLNPNIQDEAKKKGWLKA